MGCGSSGTQAENTTSSTGAPASKDDKRTAKEENKEFAQDMEFLRKVPLFQRLPKSEYPLLAVCCVNEEFPPGQAVIKQGDAGSEFFVIKTGEASVTMIQSDGNNAETVKKVATLKAGDYFGENALLRDEPRMATITADTRLLTLKITREKFVSLGLQDKLQFANRNAVGAGGQKTLQTKPPSPKTSADTALITNALKQNENLQTMVLLDTNRCAEIAAVAWKEQVPKGKEVIMEGDLNADYFYVVNKGNFEVMVKNNGEAVPQSAERAMAKTESKVVGQIGPGGSFGELALLYLVPRAATVKATTDAEVWVIDRVNFKSILMKVSNEKINEYVGYLNRVNMLDPLSTAEKEGLAKAFVEMHFTQGELITQQGDVGSTFYVLYEGEAEIIKDNKHVGEMKASKGRNDPKFCGEKALLNNEPRAATIRVTSETAKALALDRDSFNMLLGPLQDIMNRGDAPSGVTVKGPKGKVPGGSQRSGDKINRKDLTRIGLLGCGGFGSVELYEHKVTKDTYAMKGISKGYIVKTGMQESVMNEKNILMMTNSTFIIKLWETYNGTQTLYFLLEVALGGELYATYNRKGLHGSERHAKFYIAGVICGFEHLHQRRIIYRDLKPENLLLNEVGCLKITDMGLAKFVIGKTYTTCGTPDYFAPELIRSTGHTTAVDWWTLGILIFEMMSGHPPFESAYPMQIYSKVMKGISKVQFPPKCQGHVGDMIKGLLKKEPSERLPMRPRGVANLREHKWYLNFDWKLFEEGSMEAPYQPKVKSKRDIANYFARKEDMPRQIEYIDDGSGWDADFAS